LIIRIYEVIYLGFYNFPEHLIEVALQEDVDAIGVSFLGGEHLYYTRKLTDLMKKKNITTSPAIAMMISRMVWFGNKPNAEPVFCMWTMVRLPISGKDSPGSRLALIQCLITWSVATTQAAISRENHLLHTLAGWFTPDILSLAGLTCYAKGGV